MCEVGRLDLHLFGGGVKKGLRKIVGPVVKFTEAQCQSDGIFRLVQVRTNFDAIDPLAGSVKLQGKLISRLGVVAKGQDHLAFGPELEVPLAGLSGRPACQTKELISLSASTWSKRRSQASLQPGS